METRTIVLNSEFEFRESLTQNSCNITQIMVVKCPLEQMVYFYYYTETGYIYTAKELSLKNFSFYKKMYKRITKELGLQIFPNTYQLIAVKKP